MNLIRAIATTMLVLCPLAAFGHGGGEHFMGTVKSLDEKAITVETKDKKEVKISISAETKFEKSGMAATGKDLAVGEKVVVHTAKANKGEEPKAVLVKFGTPPAGKQGDAHGPNGGPAHEPHAH